MCIYTHITAENKVIKGKINTSGDYNKTKYKKIIWIIEREVGHLDKQPHMLWKMFYRITTYLLSNLRG